VIVPPTGIRMLVATKPVDFRKGMDGLAAYVQLELQSDPFCSIVYVFRAKRADRVKLLFWIRRDRASSPSDWRERSSAGPRSLTA